MSSMKPPQATCIAQVESDLQREGVRLKRQKVLVKLLRAQLVVSKQEVARLQDKVHQMQHAQHTQNNATCRDVE